VIVPLETNLRDVDDGDARNLSRFHDLRRRGYFAEAFLR